MGGLGLMALASFLLGILAVLGPLHLSNAGWGAAAIGAVWLVGAALESLQAPFVGRLSDRRGRLLPVRISLAASALVSLGLATGPKPLFYVPLVVAAATAYGMLFTPAFALIADGAEHVGLAQGMAFGLMNAAWALGAIVGPAAGGAVAAATGDWIPFLLAAGVCASALALIGSRHEGPAVLVERVPRDPARVGRE
jgi:MFS family permease